MKLTILQSSIGNEKKQSNGFAGIKVGFVNKQ